MGHVSAVAARLRAQAPDLPPSSYQRQDPVSQQPLPAAPALHATNTSGAVLGGIPSSKTPASSSEKQLQRQLGILEGTNALLRDNLERAEKEKAMLKKQIAEIRGKETASATIAAGIQQNGSFRVSEMQRQLGALKQQLLFKDQEVDELKKDLTDRMERLHQLEATSATLQADLQQAQHHHHHQRSIAADGHHHHHQQHQQMEVDNQPTTRPAIEAIAPSSTAPSPLPPPSLPSLPSQDNILVDPSYLRAVEGMFILDASQVISTLWLRCRPAMQVLTDSSSNKSSNTTTYINDNCSNNRKLEHQVQVLVKDIGTLLPMISSNSSSSPVVLLQTLVDFVSLALDLAPGGGGGDAKKNLHVHHQQQAARVHSTTAACLEVIACLLNVDATCAAVAGGGGGGAASSPAALLQPSSRVTIISDPASSSYTSHSSGVEQYSNTPSLNQVNAETFIKMVIAASHKGYQHHQSAILSIAATVVNGLLFPADTGPSAAAGKEHLLSLFLNLLESGVIQAIVHNPSSDKQVVQALRLLHILLEDDAVCTAFQQALLSTRVQSAGGGGDNVREMQNGDNQVEIDGGDINGATISTPGSKVRKAGSNSNANDAEASRAAAAVLEEENEEESYEEEERHDSTWAVSLADCIVFSLSPAPPSSIAISRAALSLLAMLLERNKTAVLLYLIEDHYQQAVHHHQHGKNLHYHHRHHQHHQPSSQGGGAGPSFGSAPPLPSGPPHLHPPSLLLHHHHHQHQHHSPPVPFITQGSLTHHLMDLLSTYSQSHCEGSSVLHLLSDPFPTGSGDDNSNSGGGGGGLEMQQLEWWSRLCLIQETLTLLRGLVVNEILGAAALDDVTSTPQSGRRAVTVLGRLILIEQPLGGGGGGVVYEPVAVAPWVRVIGSSTAAAVVGGGEEEGKNEKGGGRGRKMRGGLPCCSVEDVVYMAKSMRVRVMRRMKLSR